jgi:hypothetical protein
MAMARQTWLFSVTVWDILRSSDNSFTVQSWGISGDIPVAGDYDSDGKFDFAVWRSTDRFWYALRSSNNSGLFVPFGTIGDVPLPSAFVP